MLQNKIRRISITLKSIYAFYPRRFYGIGQVLCRAVKPQEHSQSSTDTTPQETVSVGLTQSTLVGDLYPTSNRVVPLVMRKEEVVLPFDDVPGPKSLKLLSNARNYLSELGTQITANLLTVGYNLGNFVTAGRSVRNLTPLFNQYGPVVRFVSPIGRDIVLINHPDHIQKVYSMEGDSPVRSTLDSLEKYRTECRTEGFGGLYNMLARSKWKISRARAEQLRAVRAAEDLATHGQDWIRQRTLVDEPLNRSVSQHMLGLSEVCDSFTRKVYNMRNHHDEVNRDLYKEIHKWAFDCMGLLIFSKRFTMLETDLVYNQCDTSWLYHSLEQSTEAILKCESGMHLWKLFATPAWKSLVKHCDNLDSLIGKHVMEAEQKAASGVSNEELDTTSLITCMLTGKETMRTEDIATVLMDMLLIGVNTITTSTSFLLYLLAKHQKAQRTLYEEISKVYMNNEIQDVVKTTREMPYMQACIKETLRLVPPIPVLTRILSKNITLDKYNIPRGTLIIMSNEDASLKESNFEEATKFIPDRWLKPDAKEYHAFASIPFGFGARKCLGQGIAETMMTMLTARILQKFKLEYHYGDIEPTRTFIVRPNKQLKIRFIDRM